MQVASSQRVLDVLDTAVSQDPNQRAMRWLGAAVRRRRHLRETQTQPEQTDTVVRRSCQGNDGIVARTPQSPQHLVARDYQSHNGTPSHMVLRHGSTGTA